MDIRLRALKIASSRQSDFAYRDWKDWEVLWPALEAMADEGATIVVKLDGGRTQKPFPKRYTVVLTGGKLGDDFFREDTAILEDALCKAVLFYAEKVWKEEATNKG